MIVMSSGGVDADAIRPLFVLAFVITVGTFVFILTQLSGQRWGAARDAVERCSAISARS